MFVAETVHPCTFTHLGLTRPGRAALVIKSFPVHGCSFESHNSGNKKGDCVFSCGSVLNARKDILSRSHGLKRMESLHYLHRLSNTIIPQLRFHLSNVIKVFPELCKDNSHTNL